MKLSFATLQEIKIGSKLYRFVGCVPKYFGKIVAIYDTFIIINPYGSSGLITETDAECLIKNNQSNEYSFIEPGWNFMTKDRLFLDSGENVA